MKIISKDGKHFLQGKQEEVAKALLKTAKKATPDGKLGWTLDKQADEASSMGEIRHRYDDCSSEQLFSIASP